MINNLKKSLRYSLPLTLILFQTTLYADVNSLEDIVIHEGHETSLIGEAISSSEGVITQSEIASRPVLRTGEILEFVPGMVVTQHSGSGKANQYFLRGFNLDHGTDFSTSVEGMPINMRTHGHGQGYTDLNFIIPEFVERIDYQKGPYHAEDGDFSATGSARFSLLNHLKSPFVSVELGEDGYQRTVMGTDIDIGENELLLGLEAHQYDGPWDDVREDVEKYNFLARLHRPLAEGDLTMTLMGYKNSWNSADQIPSYAVEEGIISDLGSIDTTVGGESSRYSLSGKWRNDDLLVDAFAIKSSLNLYSNFTYFLDDPINGDQFEQIDERMLYGANILKRTEGELGKKALYQDFGVQLRHDNIDEVGLNKTKERQYLSTVRNDNADVSSLGLFWEGEVELTDKLSMNTGVRYDYMKVDVTSNIAQNSGKADDGLFSFKGGLRYTFNDKFDAYVNAGQSFHSNDARGAVISVDPVSNEKVNPVDLLVQAQGAEVGLRFFETNKLNVSAALWMLDLDSELLFVGDAGNTEANRASRRHGIELTAYYWLSDHFNLDFEAAWTQARYKDDVADEGNRIEGSLPMVVSAGMTWNPTSNWDTSIRIRHFDKRVLDSYDEQDSDPFTVVNVGLGYQKGHWQYGLDVLNLFDSNDQDIAYYYASRLSSSVNSREDVHFHPIEPRTARVHVRYNF
ncbi:MAG: Outer membrane receptor proteins, mostly Fe transport [uncultured Sulfurovum sp.]|uniref:Outer membrane receptor proteins, mostly Fe transport n=1 Tax=uncultured Sulfurovum sp. TaxID=269237 RepID=A0A6S6SYW3_9BACT|nr:MAG: Outer membrane receptor proteins, mostly Fe transport [uncultured Sulfurovum sp.]